MERQDQKCREQATQMSTNKGRDKKEKLLYLCVIEINQLLVHSVLMNIKKVMLSERSSKNDLPLILFKTDSKKEEKLSYDIRNQISGWWGCLSR